VASNAAVLIRLTLSERAQVQLAAARQGVSLNSYCRQVLLRVSLAVMGEPALPHGDNRVTVTNPITQQEGGSHEEDCKV
jgi:hypothetical protein